MFEQEEDETDSGTMVRASGDESGTIRAVNTLGDGANTMIEHDGTLESQLGTMVINTEEEEEEGTMKSKKTSDFWNIASIFAWAGMCIPNLL